MLPTHWPKWILIPLALGLTVVTVIIGLVLEPAVQALTPHDEPTPESIGFPTRLPYAAPLSGGCIECHADETALTDAGASAEDVQRLLITPDSAGSLHGRLGCVTCHDGIGHTQNVDAAHQELVANPSQPQEADTYCLPCHHDLRTDIPEKHIHTPHERILWGIHEDKEVCACSNCHGPVAHGDEPIRTHEFLGGYCIDCHEEKDVPPERLKCSGCHIGPHDVAEAMDCETCHTSTNTWSTVELAVHPMELNGRHAELACFECHIEPNFREISNFVCDDCHTQPHDFGEEQSCDECHVDGQTWTETKEGGFDHTQSWDYHVGEHTKVDCQGCHFEGYQELPADCGSCHELNPDTCNEEQACTDCHISDKVWSDVTQ